MLDTAAVGYQAVLTKSDKPKQGELSDCIAETTAELARHTAAHPALLVTSAAQGVGIDPLRAEVTGLLKALAGE